MRFMRNNLLLLTLCVIVGIATLDSKNAFAGGDPSIKDNKVKKQKSNIKQHDHSILYVDKQNKLSSKNKKNKSNTNISNNKNNLNKNENKITNNNDLDEIKKELIELKHAISDNNEILKEILLKTN